MPWPSSKESYQESQVRELSRLNFSFGGNFLKTKLPEIELDILSLLHSIRHEEFMVYVPGFISRFRVECGSHRLVSLPEKTTSTVYFQLKQKKTKEQGKASLLPSATWRDLTDKEEEVFPPTGGTFDRTEEPRV